MTTRMLIDARHREETRVAVLKGNRIEEFDFESAEHKQIKGNIYLAKVTRVEPSLQAAFVDFGGNRHGFLAFSEIHPDYYQIPKEDREALLAEEAEHAAEEEALRAADGDYDDDGADDGTDDAGGDFSGDDFGEGAGGVIEVDTSEKDQVATIEAGLVEAAFDDDDGESGPEAGFAHPSGDPQDGDALDGDALDEDADDDTAAPRGNRRQGQSRGRSKQADELRAKRMELRRRYKIQDVIHRRQVLLVQVVKEERGNKGAALTTYLSLAGRYCVLMPNSSHGGGISRKISSAADRKRLKGIIGELGLPKSMGCIVRTAGLQRTRVEIKRDFDYLARLWDEIRENTLGSSAPALIHSDSDLIKRAIRDIYNREIEEVVVEGDDGYRAARAFMKLLMPSHVRKVKVYADPVPLFQRYGAEDQLTAMYDPVVQLRSGGYIVINPTEALVSIDINSGRSTKEYGIEATALNTNLEASREIARQLRLRDMAGLVVIDFIDMEHGSNVRKVEKSVKDALRDDRARIQVGRISSFGLMEMSRQRLRTGVLEATTRTCPHCDGSGLVRTASSAGLSALRLIEDEAAKGRGTLISLCASTEAAIYLLNAKRSDLRDIEERYGVFVEVIPEGENEGAKMRVGSSGPRPEPRAQLAAPAIEEDDDDYEIEEDEFDGEVEAGDVAPRGGDDGERVDRPDRAERPARAERAADGDDAGQGRKRRKRRRGGRGRREDSPALARDDDENGLTSDDDREDRAGEAEADDAGFVQPIVANDDGGLDDDGEGDGDDGDVGDEEVAGDDGLDDAGAPRKRRRRSRRRRGARDRGDDGPGAGGVDDVEREAEPVADELIEALPPAIAEPFAEPFVSDDLPPEPLLNEPLLPESAWSEPLAPDEDLPEPVSAMADDAPVEPAAKRARRKRGDAVAADVEDADGAAAGVDDGVPVAKPKATRRRKADIEAPAPVVEDPPAKPRRARRGKSDAVDGPAADALPDRADTSTDAGPTDTGPTDAGQSPPAEPWDDRGGEAQAGDHAEPVPALADAADAGDAGTDADDAPRRGWWQRTFGG